MNEMQASYTIDEIELAELSKLINKHKLNDIRKRYMQTIEHALINGGVLEEVKRKLGIGIKEIYDLSDEEGNVTTNMGRIVEVAEEFYSNLI